MFARENDFDGAFAAAAGWKGSDRVALLKAIVAQESSFNPGAVGDDGHSLGLAQVQFATAQALGYSGSSAGLLDPATNLDLASKLLDELEGQLPSRPEVISAYNCGVQGGRTRCLRADGTFTNQSYVDRVLSFLAYFGGSASGSTSTVTIMLLVLAAAVVILL